MTAHAERAHATWSASSTDRNWNCSGALALTMDLPETTSEAADWGTCCHEVAEITLRSGGDAADLIGTSRMGKQFSFDVDDEMAETAQAYVDYVRNSAASGSGLWIEQRFSLASLNPPFDAGGTGDAVIWNPTDRLLEVVDLKGGRGVVVEAKGNPQLRTYALGAMLANPGLPVDSIRVTIVQPRAGHKDGRIRSETFSTVDLVEWTADLMRAMHRAKTALDTKDKMPIAAWAAAHLQAGPHCKFCKAAAFCPALEQKALDEAGVWFDDLDQPRLANAPETLSPERMAQLLDAADMIEDWINAVRHRAHQEAEGGVTIPNYVLVEKQGREKWTDEDAARKAAEASGLAEGGYLNPGKLRTPKQIRDALKKAKLDPAVVAGLSEVPNNGTQLVRTTKTTREAVTPKAHQHFSVLD
jgi:hypothetical protein